MDLPDPAASITPAAITVKMTDDDADGNSSRNGIANTVTVTGTSAMTAAAALGPRDATARLKAKTAKKSSVTIDLEQG